MEVHSGSSVDKWDITAGKTGKVSLFSAAGIELLDSEQRLPVTQEPSALGYYMLALRTGLITATLADGSTLFSLIWAGSRRFQLRRFAVQAMVTATITTAVLWGVDLFFGIDTVSNDTGGAAANPTGEEAKKATGWSTSNIDGSTATADGATTEIRIATTAALTAGTRTLRTNPLAQWRGYTGTVVGTKIFEDRKGMLDHLFLSTGAPVQLADSEGLYLVSDGAGPATGTFELTIDLEWAELEA